MSDTGSYSVKVVPQASEAIRGLVESRTNHPSSNLINEDVRVIVDRSGFEEDRDPSDTEYDPFRCYKLLSWPLQCTDT